MVVKNSGVAMRRDKEDVVRMQARMAINDASMVRMRGKMEKQDDELAAVRDVEMRQVRAALEEQGAMMMVKDAEIDRLRAVLGEQKKLAEIKEKYSRHVEGGLQADLDNRKFVHRKDMEDMATLTHKLTISELQNAELQNKLEHSIVLFEKAHRHNVDQLKDNQVLFAKYQAADKKAKLLDFRNT